MLDLSCQSCEFAQVLRAVQRACPEVSSLEEAAAWLLEHLPPDEKRIREMSKSLRLRRAKIHGKGDGRDLQSGFEVASHWLNARESWAAPWAAPAVAEGEGSASEVLERFLPRSRCEACDASLSPPFRFCRACLPSPVANKKYRLEKKPAKRVRVA